MKKIIYTIILLLSCSSIYAQKSIKHKEQQSKFYYGQLNLHGGLINDNTNGQRWGLSTRSPKNQAVFQVVSINKKTLQKGYIKKFALTGWKFRMGFEYDNNKTIDNVTSGNVKFKLYDTFLKFGTKWDRTSLIIGNKSIPYGHNPKIDPAISFMINPIKMDLGFGQDLGVFFKTPMTNNLDFEISITSGGVLNKPVLVCNNLIINDENGLGSKPDFNFGKYEYNDTWLITSRIGSPSFNKNEFGAIFLSGKILSTVFDGKPLTQVNRIGIDWVFKQNERFKLVNQAIIGKTSVVDGKEYFSKNIVNNLDYYTGNHFMLSLSHSMNILTGSRHIEKLKNYSLAGSLTYIFSPHTRLRLNTFYTAITDREEYQSGVLLQFVTGIGKRP